MKSTKYIMPGLILAALVLGGGSAYAFSGSGKTVGKEVFSSYQTKSQKVHKKVRGMYQHRESVRSAIEAEDYEAFVKALVGTPREGKVTEDQFNTLVEAHVLLKAGDKKGAFELMKEAGFGKPKRY
jgi:hypothetical protein